MSIDIHNHIIPQNVIDLCLNDPAFGVSVSNGLWHSPNIHDFPLVDAWFDPTAKLKELDGRGLERAVLSAAPKPLYYYELELKHQELMARTLNEGAAAFCQGHEDRLRWMASVPLAFPDDAAVVLADAVAAGASGVEIGTGANDNRIDTLEFEPFWDAVESLEVPVFLHPAYEHKLPEYAPYDLGLAIGLPVESTTALERLIVGGTLDRHPKVTVVAALGGGCFPYLAGRLRFYSTFTPGLRDAPPDPWDYVGQIKFDSHLHDPVTLRFLIEKAGAENVLIGTDCSFLSGTPDPITELRDAVGGDDETFDKVSFGNAQSLFWKS